MAIDAAALRKEVNGSASDPDDAEANACLSIADELLKAYAGDGYRTLGEIPIVIAEKAWLLVGAAVFNQRKAPNGILNQVVAGPDGTPVSSPVRISTDPLRPAYGLLERFVLGVTFS